MSSDLALATSSLVNPFMPTPGSHLASLTGQSGLGLASAAQLLPVFGAGSKSGLIGAPRAATSSAANLFAPSALDQHAHRLAAATGTLSGWCLFVYNLAPEVEESVIWKLFGPFGAVRQVNLVKDAQTNKCRGFAFVTMSDYNQALMAIQSLNGFMLANRVLQVSFKTSKVRKTMQQQQQAE